MKMMAAIQYILTAAQLLGSRDYYKKYRLMIRGIAGVLLCENEHRQNGLSHDPKKILTWMLREARGDLKTTVGNRVLPDYHFIHIGFCFFLFLSARVLFPLAGYAQKHSSTYWTLWASARLRF